MMFVLILNIVHSAEHCQHYCFQNVISVFHSWYCLYWKQKIKYQRKGKSIHSKPSKWKITQCLTLNSHNLAWCSKVRFSQILLLLLWGLSTDLMYVQHSANTNAEYFQEKCCMVILISKPFAHFSQLENKSLIVDHSDNRSVSFGTGCSHIPGGFECLQPRCGARGHWEDLPWLQIYWKCEYKWK